MKQVTNLAASVRQRLVNAAKQRGESVDYVASLYARERFLGRLARSPHRNRLVLKGATEKLHAMVKLGIANSRMKDFFDVYVLASRREFDQELLATAVRRTFARRRTIIPAEAFALTAEFYVDRQKQIQWRAFLRKSGIDAPEDFAIIGGRLRAFLVPLLDGARSPAQ